MAEKTFSERLQPALIDRLSNVPPGDQPDPPERRSLDRRAFREAVLRDLRWLLNCTRPPAETPSSADWPGRPPAIDWSGRAQARRSVINFGMPVLSGETASTLDPTALAAAVRRAILDFEPRIAPQSLKVEVQATDMQMQHHNVIGMVISGMVWAQPQPLEMNLRTQMHLETGQVDIEDMSR
jgi:type VI secretion system protein ImpF